MEKANELSSQKKISKEVVLKTVVFVLLGVLIPLFSKENISLLLYFPFISLCFYLGGLELFSSLIGIICGSFIMSSETLFISLIGMVIYFIFLFISKITPFKMKTRLIITSFISDVFIRYIQSSILMIPFNLDWIFISLAIGLVSYILLYYASSFLSSKKFMHPYILFFISLLIVLFSFLLPRSFVNVITLSTLIFVSIVGGLSIGIVSNVGVTLLTYIYLNEVSFEFVLIGIITSLLSSQFNKSKASNLLVNLIGALFVIYITDYDVSNYYLLIEFLISFLIIFCVPFKVYTRLKKKFLSHDEIFEYQEVKYRRIHEKIGLKMQKISDAYSNLKLIMKEDNSLNLKQKRLDIMFNDLCKLCPKNKTCHEEKSNKIESLASDLLIKNLNFEERLYIEENCLKPTYFINEGMLQRVYYECESKHESEYNKLKQTIVDNLTGITSSLERLKDDFEHETGILVNGMEKNIYILLEQLHIEPIFVNYQEDHLNETLIEIAIKISEKYHIEEIIRTKLEEYLNKPLKINKIRTMPYENIIRITYSGFKNYHISFGVAQLSKDELYCGDSYVSFNCNDEKYFVISDGMGYGKEAYLESKSTIDCFKQIVETGVKPTVAIKTINSILKIRHKKECFSTLDILKIDEVKYVASITKTCAPSSYLFRNNKIKEIDSYALPIGIVDDVEAYDTVFDIQKDDILIMCSDGFKLSAVQIEEFLKENKSLPSQTMTEKLLSYSKQDLINDDITLFVIKVI